MVLLALKPVEGLRREMQGIYREAGFGEEKEVPGLIWKQLTQIIRLTAQIKDYR